MSQRAVFLDRDGVLVADRGIATRIGDLEILPRVPEAMRRLSAAGFKLIVVTNQAVVARGLLSEEELDALHESLALRLLEAGAPAWDAIYSCPHHPNASIPKYRLACGCRKPQPGMIVRASQEHGLIPSRCYLVGDRMSDIVAGNRSGCKTVWLSTGQHTAPPIESGHLEDALLHSAKADQQCGDLFEATDWILSQR